MERMVDVDVDRAYYRIQYSIRELRQDAGAAFDSVTRNTGKVPSSSLNLLRQDVLIDPEEIVWIIFSFNLPQPCVIAPVACLDPVLPFIHHKIKVSASLGIGMKLLPVVLTPPADFRSVLSQRIYANYDARVLGVPVGPCRRIGRHPRGGAAHGIKVHLRE